MTLGNVPSPEPDLVPLEATVQQLLKAADFLVDHDYVMPGVMLIYCTIDTLAWLSLPDGREEVHGSDFVRWVRQYGLESRINPCSAEEFYGARCGLPHSYSSDSKHSRQGKVRPILYIRGWAGRKVLQDEIDKRGVTGVALHIGDLREGLDASIQRFREDNRTNQDLRARVVRRSAKLLRPKIPDEYIEHFKAVLGWLQARETDSTHS